MKYTKEYLEELVKESNSLKELMERCELNWYSSQNHIKTLIKKYKINTSHFKSEGSNSWITKDNNEIFTISSKINRSSLRQKIIKENLIPYKCGYCGCDDRWMGKIMPLILDHINGVGDDNRLNNLRWLCSNCDSIQDTYKNKNINSNNNKNRHLKKLDKNKLRLEEKILKNEKKENIKSLILNSKINFQEMGWGTQLSKLLKKEPAGCLNWVKRNMPAFYEEKCWKKFTDKDKFIRKEEISRLKKEAKLNKLKENIEYIKNSGIDFNKRGCFVEANKILNFKETSDAIKWLKRNMPELLIHP